MIENNKLASGKMAICHICNDTILVQVSEQGVVKLIDLSTNDFKTIDTSLSQTVVVQDFLDNLRRIGPPYNSFSHICKVVAGQIELFNNLYTYAICFIDDAVVIDFKRNMEDCWFLTTRTFSTLNEANLFLYSKRLRVPAHLQQKIDEYLQNCTIETKYQNILDIAYDN